VTGPRASSRLRKHRVAGAAALAALLAAGCGTQAPDLFLITRTGVIPGARVTLRVTDDGFVSCDRGADRELPSDLLLDARALERDLQRPAARGLSLAPGPRAILTYRVRTADGTVRFSDTSGHQPPVFYRTALFVRQVAQEVCGLPR
jgi:hypothetical protein